MRAGRFNGDGVSTGTGAFLTTDFTDRADPYPKRFLPDRRLALSATLGPVGRVELKT